VGTTNVGFRAPACLTFYCGAVKEGAHCHTRQTPLIRAHLRSGNRSKDPSGGDHIPNNDCSIRSALTTVRSLIDRHEQEAIVRTVASLHAGTLGANRATVLRAVLYGVLYVASV
jgi:hypothetical protein